MLQWCEVFPKTERKTWSGRHAHTRVILLWVERDVREKIDIRKHQDGKKEFRANHKTTNQGEMEKTRNKPNKNREHRTTQSKSFFQNPWIFNKSNHDANKDKQRGGCYICSDLNNKWYNGAKKYGQPINRSAMMMYEEEKIHVAESVEDTYVMSTLAVQGEERKDRSWS